MLRVVVVAVREPLLMRAGYQLGRSRGVNCGEVFVSDYASHMPVSDRRSNKSMKEAINGKL